MRTTFKVIAWIGMALMTSGVVMSFYIMWALMISPAPPSAQPTFGPEGIWLLIVPLDFIGLGLILIGGLVGSPRYFWMSCVIIGVLHIVISIPPEWGYLVRRINEEGTGGFGKDLLSPWVLPGLIAIFEGILVRITDKILIKQGRI